MKKIPLLVFFAGLFVIQPILQAGPAPSSTISFPSGSETISARLVAPEGNDPFPAVILVHEWWGLNEWVGRKAEEIAQQGFVALAVDLYRGKSTADRDEAHELMRGLPDDRALRDLSAAMDYLQNHPRVKGRKIGVMGWCMGGGLALKLAVTRADLAACVVYYGSLPTEKSSLRKISCPLIGFFGAEDRGISVQAVNQFKESMEEMGRSNVTVRIYERAGHAFLNDTQPSYHKPAAVDSWKRALTFLSNNLQQ